MFAAFGEAIGLRKAVEAALAGVDRTSPNALPCVDLYLGFLVGVLTGASRFLHRERLRSGNATSGDNVVAFLRECLGLAKDRVKLACLRADSGFFHKRILDFLEDQHLLYIVKAPFLPVSPNCRAVLESAARIAIPQPALPFDG